RSPTSAARGLRIRSPWRGSRPTRCGRRAAAASGRVARVLRRFAPAPTPPRGASPPDRPQPATSPEGSSTPPSVSFGTAPCWLPWYRGGQLGTARVHARRIPHPLLRSACAAVAAVRPWASAGSARACAAVCERSHLDETGGDKSERAAKQRA